MTDLLEKVLPQFEEYFDEDNFTLFEEIIDTQNAEKIAQLTQQEQYFGDRVGQVQYLLGDLGRLKLSDDILRLILDSMVKVMGKIGIFYNIYPSNKSLIKIFNDEELAIFNAFKSFSVPGNPSFFNQASKYDVNIFADLYDEFLTFEETMFSYNGKLVLLCLMSSDSKFIEKYDIISNLEAMLATRISSTYRNTLYFKLEDDEQVEIGKTRLDTFNKFDIENDNFEVLYNIYNSIFNGMVYKTNTEAFPNAVTLSLINKSEFLDKYVFMLSYMRVFEYNVINKFPEFGEVNEECNQEILKFIEKFPRHKVPLSLGLSGYVFDELLVTLEEYYDFIYKVPVFNNCADFVSGKTDTLDFTIYYRDVTDETEVFKEHINLVKDNPNYYILLDGSNINLFKNLLAFSTFFKDKTDLQKRAKFPNLISYNERDNWKAKVIECAKFANEFELSKTYLHAVNRPLDVVLGNGIKKDVKNNVFNSEVFEALVELFSSSDEYIEFCLSCYKQLSVFTKTILIRSMGRKLDEFGDKFVALNETSKTLIGVTISVYKEHPQLAEKLLSMLNSKKLAERKNAFALLTQSYGGDYDHEIKQACDVEKNEKLKTEMEIFLLSKSN